MHRSTATPTASARRHWLAFRALWLLMLASHAPLFVRASFALLEAPTLQAGIRAGVVGLTLVLFVLKLIDLPLLRVPSSPAVWLRMSVIVALMHAGVLARAMEQAQIHASAPVALTTIWAAALPAVLLVRKCIPYRTQRVRLRPARERDRCLLRLRARLERSSLLLRPQRVALRAVPLRAPPVL